LVAMLEATRGKRFQDIIIEEYANIRKASPHAGVAYEIVCLFYMYDVMIPLDLLINLVQCCDKEDFEATVLKFTYLVIVRDACTTYGLYYRPRHREIAKILIESLETYNSSDKILKRMGFILKTLDFTDRRQRYTILNVLNNFVTDIVKYKPKDEFIDRIEEVAKLTNKYKERIEDLMVQAKEMRYLGELISWSRLFERIKDFWNNVLALKLQLELEPNSKIANYKLAILLSRSYIGSQKPDIVIDHFNRSFLAGNRSINFLYEYMKYCIQQQLFEHLDDKIDNIARFVSYTDEEHELVGRLKAIIYGYKLNRDKGKLADRFAEIIAHINASKELESADEFAYIDLMEQGNPRDLVKKYEIYLEAIKPNRPKKVLLRIAYFLSKIKGEEDRAIRYYYELYDKYISPSIQLSDYHIIIEYANCLTKIGNSNYKTIYMLFRTCIRLNEEAIEPYYFLAKYAHSRGDKEFACSLAKNGLLKASILGKYNTDKADYLKSIIKNN